ncbi:Phosphoinositide phosphatase SAC2 [Bienertia sinuspersici]
MGSESNNNDIINTSNNCDDCEINNEINELIGSSDIEEQQLENCSPQILNKFKLYETRANFYMVGRDKSKKFWRILKIDRSEPSNIDVFEDPTLYSNRECSSILRCIDEGNKHIGGLKFVTMCYGIVGFIKFLGPYYMLLITERRKVGIICGHAIYAVSKSKMIAIPHSPMRSNSNNSKNENRYKKLLCTVDITKDFFFSYSYRIMRSLQKNLCDEENKPVPYETMFVWNAFLTREIRSQLGNTSWTVALIHGFFKQVKYTRSGRTVHLTLLARRSRHYAGTRYLKRGVNEKGRAANDVETEQIVVEEIPGACVSEISSVVQIRGSIPLLWSQETSRMNLRPDIIMSKEDPFYEATRRHFQNLVDRYGNPIYILNLIKTKEKKPRESVLHAEFVKAVASINKTLDRENRLKFRTIDLTRLYRIKGDKVLMLLNKVAGNALNQTGFFYCQVPPVMNSGFSTGWSLAATEHEDTSNITEFFSSKTPRLQSGVLRTNCIDCLDRTNAAQYAYGLIALGHQLHAIGMNSTPKIDLDDTLAKMLMGLYEAMGDTLALQYGGSAAHNKIFSDIKGHWKAATQSQEFIRTLQRYLNNAYMDPEKQDAINLFLGHFQPDVNKPALWELDSDQHCSIGRLTPSMSDDITRSFLKRSMSDGVLIYESAPSTPADVNNYNHTLPDLKEDKSGLSESTPEITTCETNTSYARFTPSMSARQLFTEMPATQYLRGECSCYAEHGSEFDCSDILDLDWISSSGNSCEEDTYDRSSLLTSPSGGSSIAPNDPAEGSTVADFSFERWVEFGATLA